MMIGSGSGDEVIVTVVLPVVTGEFSNSTPFSLMPPGGTVGQSTAPSPEKSTTQAVGRLWLATTKPSIAIDVPVIARDRLPPVNLIGYAGSPSHRSSLV